MTKEFKFHTEYIQLNKCGNNYEQAVMNEIERAYHYIKYHIGDSRTIYLKLKDGEFLVEYADVYMALKQEVDLWDVRFSVRVEYE